MWEWDCCKYTATKLQLMWDCCKYTATKQEYLLWDCCKYTATKLQYLLWNCCEYTQCTPDCNLNLSQSIEL